MSKNLTPRESLMAAIERQQALIDRLTEAQKVGRASQAQIDEATRHATELYRNALGPGRRVVASFADGVLTEFEPVPESFVPATAERRSAPTGNQKPASTSDGHRARLANATKELHIWHLRRAALAANDLADAQERMNTPHQAKQAPAQPTNPQALDISIGLKLRHMARTLNDRN